MIMAHGVIEVLSADDAGSSATTTKMVTVKPQQRVNGARKPVGVMGSRRIFPPAFKLKVLDSYRNDAECRGNQRATARKYGIHRRQIQKWLQCEDNLRKGCQEVGDKSRQEKASDNSGLVRSSPASSPASLAGAVRLPVDGMQSAGSPPSPSYVYNSGKLMPLAPVDVYHRSQYYGGVRSSSAWSSRCDLKRYSGSGTNGYAYPEVMAPPSTGSLSQQYSEVKTERTASPEASPMAYDPVLRAYEKSSRYQDREVPNSAQVGSIVKTEKDEATEEENSRMEEERTSELVALKRERESTDSETERRSPAGMSPLTPSQEPPSPQGPSSGSYRSSSDSDVDADYSSSSCSSSQHPADLARRRSFSLQFKLDVLDAFHRDTEVAGNQRATAKKFNINRRQVQKWLVQEAVLRDEIALRGGMSRQRLASVQDVSLYESPVDLRTRNHPEVEVDHRPISYCCEIGASPQPYVYCNTQDLSYRTCSYSCCSLVAPGCLPEAPPRKRPCYEETRPLYCYSPNESSAMDAQYKGNPPCCYDPATSPSKQENGPPQDAPLCLVKTKTEPTVAPSTKKDAILFKPYLDNPVSRPNDDLGHNNNYFNNNNNNNDNCNTVCNLNEKKGQDYALQLNLQVPVSWASQAPPPIYTDLPQVRSAFVRYPASSRFT